MTSKQISSLLLGLLPTIYQVAFGHETDLNMAADALQGVADSLRAATSEPQPMTMP